MKNYLFIALLFIYSFVYADLITNQQIGGDDPSILGLWHFNSGTGATAYDVSGNNNHAVVTNAPWVDGRLGKCLDYNGSNTNTQCGVSVIPNTAHSLTVWIKVGNVKEGIIMGNNRFSLSREGTSIRIGPDGKIDILIAYHNIAEGFSTNVSDNLADGKWHYLVLTWDGGQGTDAVKFYVDGVLTGSISPGAGATDQTTQNLTFGKVPELDIVFFDGLIEEAAVINGVLLIAKIIYNFQSQSLARQ